MSDRIDTARALFRAYATSDRAVAEGLIAESFRFTSPVDNALDRESYFRICWANADAISGFDIVHAVEDGDRVFMTYEGTAGEKRFRNTEILTIEQGKVRAVEVYFGWNLPHDLPPGTHSAS